MFKLFYTYVAHNLIKQIVCKLHTWFVNYHTNYNFMYFVKHQDIYQIVLNKYCILLNLQINFVGSVNVRNICILIRQIMCVPDKGKLIWVI